MTSIGISWGAGAGAGAGAVIEAIADPYKLFVVNIGNCCETSDQPSLSSLSNSSCDFIAKFYLNCKKYLKGWSNIKTLNKRKNPQNVIKEMTEATISFCVTFWHCISDLID